MLLVFPGVNLLIFNIRKEKSLKHDYYQICLYPCDYQWTSVIWHQRYILLNSQAGLSGIFREKALFLCPWFLILMLAFHLLNTWAQVCCMVCWTGVFKKTNLKYILDYLEISVKMGVEKRTKYIFFFRDKLFYFCVMKEMDMHDSARYSNQNNARKIAESVICFNASALIYHLFNYIVITKEVCSVRKKRH